jgi:phage terminase small subunit
VRFPRDAKELVDGVPFEERRERFCGHYVESNGNGMYAFRMAFVTDGKMINKEIFHRAKLLLADPTVVERIREMQDVAAQATQASITALMQDWVDIANADPNELCAHMRVNCRHCWGINGAYQWVNMAEYLAAMREAAKHEGAAVPDCSGGFGYTLYNDPNPACTDSGCFGQGIAHVHISDTTKLAGSARKLYAGVKQKANGEIEILMHSQEKARENIARCLGAFKDAVQLPGDDVRRKPAAPVPTLEQAQQTYLQVIQGGKP